MRCRDLLFFRINDIRSTLVKWSLRNKSNFYHFLGNAIYGPISYTYYDAKVHSPLNVQYRSKNQTPGVLYWRCRSHYLTLIGRIHLLFAYVTPETALAFMALQRSYSPTIRWLCYNCHALLILFLEILQRNFLDNGMSIY